MRRKRVDRISRVQKKHVDIEKEWDEAREITARIVSRAQAYKDEIRRLQERLDYLESPEGLSNSEDFKAMKLENETLRKRHLDMRIEKGEEKHRADMLEQRVLRLESENICEKGKGMKIAGSSSFLVPEHLYGDNLADYMNELARKAAASSGSRTFPPHSPGQIGK